jgi:hypothetical protein
MSHFRPVVPTSGRMPRAVPAAPRGAGRPAATSRAGLKKKNIVQKKIFLLTEKNFYLAICV